jgi:hypothetical protein
VPRRDLQRADRKSFAIGKQLVELRAVAGEAGFEIVDLLPRRLDALDAGADAGAAAELLLEEGCRREMIGMAVRFENPVDAQARRRDNDLLCVLGLGAAGSGVEIEDRVDHRAHFARGIDDQIGHRAGFGIEKSGNQRSGGNR